jgi:mono/diheme cytochrome c family protein
MLLGILAGGLAVTAAATLSRGAPPPAVDEAIARGAQIVLVGGCNHCHTPWAFEPKLGMPVPDMKRMLSGHPAGAPDPDGKRGKRDIVLIGPTFTSFAMPFGIVYSPNLTPDKETGLGTWTEKMFVDALKTGKHMGGTGRAILPPMPWMDLGQLPESDLKAVFAYLRSLPPVRNAVPAHKVPDEAYNVVTENFEKLKKVMREKHAAHP